jgi:hypothetical protein
MSFQNCKALFETSCITSERRLSQRATRRYIPGGRALYNYRYENINSFGSFFGYLATLLQMLGLCSAESTEEREERIAIYF